MYNNIKKKTVIMMSLVFLFILMLVMLVLYLVTEELFYDNAKESAFSIANTIYIAMDDNIFSAAELATQVGTDPFAAENFFMDEEMKAHDIQTYLSNIAQIYQYDLVRIASFKTDCYYSAEGITKTFDRNNPEDQWYFEIRGRNLQDVSYIPLVIKSKEHVYFYNIQIIRDSENQPKGFFLIALDYGVALQAIQENAQNLGANIYLINSEGQLDTTFFMATQDKKSDIPIDIHDLRIEELKSDTNHLVQTSIGNISITLKYISEFDSYLMIAQDLSSHIYYTFILIFLAVVLVLLIILIIILRILDYSGKKIMKEASLDSLTQIYNRSMYNTKLVESLELCNHYGIISTLIILDIDNFKTINDQMGHQTGDDIIIKTARLLEDCKRKHDILFRWGGDEFVIIARSHLKNSMLLTNRILEASKNIHWKEHTPITFSIGVTELKADDTKKTVFDRADQALYLAKQNGKNQAYQL